MSEHEIDKQQISRRRFLKVCGLGAVAGCVAATDAYYIEPNRIEITRHEVSVPNWPGAQAPVTVAQITDLHHGPYVSLRTVRRAVQAAAGLGAHIIVLTGDFISRHEKYARPCAQVLSELRAPGGVFAVLGNHDYWENGETVTRELTRAGITVLTNASHRIAPGLWLVGVDDYWSGRPDVPRAFRDVPQEHAQIVLTHNPQIFPQLWHRRSVVLAGHTHGGQVNLPPIPRKYLPGLVGAPYIKGWYRRSNASMYVSRGVGMVTPPVRFFCLPEIAHFTFGG